MYQKVKVIKAPTPNGFEEKVNEFYEKAHNDGTKVYDPQYSFGINPNGDECYTGVLTYIENYYTKE